MVLPATCPELAPLTESVQVAPLSGDIAPEASHCGRQIVCDGGCEEVLDDGFNLGISLLDITIIIVKLGSVVQIPPARLFPLVVASIKLEPHPAQLRQLNCPQRYHHNLCSPTRLLHLTTFTMAKLVAPIPTCRRVCATLGLDSRTEQP